MENNKTFKIFIGYAGDANKQVTQIKELQHEIQQYLQDEANIFSASNIFENVKIWEWQDDASLCVGGQQDKIDPSIKECHLAIFVFKINIGNVTKEEYALAIQEKRHVFCLFPSKNILGEVVQGAFDEYEKLVQLRDFKRKLTLDWMNSPSHAITPIPEYDNDTLKEIALDKIKQVIRELYSSKTNHIKSANLSNEKSKDDCNNFEYIATSDLELKYFMRGKRLTNPSSQFYYERDLDRIIEDYMIQGSNVMIIGNSLAGKTRAAFEALKKLDNRKLVIIKSEYELSILKFDANTVLFFDDIDELLVQKGRDTLKRFLEKMIDSDMQIIATCRNGNEYRDFFNAFGYRFIEENFDVVEFNRVSDEDKHKFLHFVKQQNPNIPLDTKSYDSNIGSFFMDLSVMKDRYRDLEELCESYKKNINKKLLYTILKALYIFYYSENLIGKNQYDKNKIYDFCKRKLGSVSEKRGEGSLGDTLISIELHSRVSALTKLEFEEGLEILKDDKEHLNFLEDLSDSIYIEEAYLSRIVEEKEKSSDVLSELKQLYTEKEINDFGFFTTIYAFSKLIHKEKNIEKCFDIVQKMKDIGIQLNEVPYNSIIAKTSTLKEANDILARMIKEGIKPNEITYSSIITKTRTVQEALDILDKMTQKGIFPNVVTYNSIIAQTSTLKEANDILARMMKEGIKPNERTYNSIITKTSTLQEALDILNRMTKEKIKSNNFTSSSIIAKTSTLKEAYDILAKMIKEGVIPDVATYNSIITQTSTLKEALDILDRMAKEKIKPNNFTSSSIIAKTSTKQEAFNILARMIKEGITPDVVTYNSIITKTSTVQEAFEILERMIKEGITPDKMTPSSIIKKTSTLKEALNILDKMIQKGISPNVGAYNAIITKTSTLQESNDILARMTKEGIKPNDRTYNSMITKTSNLKEALDLLARMIKEGIKRDKFTLSSIITKIEKNDQQTVMKILESFRQWRVTVDDQVINQVKIKFNITINAKLIIS